MVGCGWREGVEFRVLGFGLSCRIRDIRIILEGRVGF